MKQNKTNNRDTHLAEKLRDYRERQGITFRELARRAGVSLTMAWRASCGKTVRRKGTGKLWNLLLEEK